MRHSCLGKKDILQAISAEMRKRGKRKTTRLKCLSIQTEMDVARPL